jgi:hypothetical protein
MILGDKRLISEVFLSPPPSISTAPTAAATAPGDVGVPLAGSCVVAVLLYLDPPKIFHMARLNRAFRGAASADYV